MPRMLLLLSILLLSTLMEQASAASFETAVEGDSLIARFATQEDFQGNEATVQPTDPSTIELRIPGANLSVAGSKQLFRFEAGAVKVASLAQDGTTAIVRMTLKNKVAGAAADMVALSRENGLVKVEFPILSEAEASQKAALTEAKTIAIPASASGETQPSEVAERVALKAENAKGKETEQTPVLANVDEPPQKPRAENEIPVLATAKIDKKDAATGLEKLVLTLTVMCALLAGALFAIKKWAEKKSKPKNNTKIQIITQHHLGPKKSIAIIQVAGEALLVGITDHNISMLKTLALIDDEVPGVVPKNFSDEMEKDFRFSDARDYPRDHRGDAGNQVGGDDGDDDEPENENFALRGLGEVRDLVSTRLKTLRNLQ